MDGNQMTKTSKLDGMRATTPTRSLGSQPSLPTTGAQRENALTTPKPRSGTGCEAVSRAATLPSAESLAVLRTVAADRDLMAVLRRSVDLRPVYGRSLVNHEPIGYLVAGEAEGLTTARRALEEMLRPVDRENAVFALAELAVTTKARAEDPETEDLRMAAYLSRLAEYPADAVLHACRAWSDHNIFWPAWRELRELLEARVSARRKMLEAVRLAEAKAGNVERLAPPAEHDGNAAARRGLRAAGAATGDLIARLAMAQ
jgi:hypothetical protein